LNVPPELIHKELGVKATGFLADVSKGLTHIVAQKTKGKATIGEYVYNGDGKRIQKIEEIENSVTKKI
jgi:hypothetical protein